MEENLGLKQKIQARDDDRHGIAIAYHVTDCGGTCRAWTALRGGNLPLHHAVLMNALEFTRLTVSLAPRADAKALELTVSISALLHELMNAKKEIQQVYHRTHGLITLLSAVGVRVDR